MQGRGLDAQLGGRLKIAGTSDNPQVSGGFTMIRGVFSLAGTSLNFTSGKVSFNGQGLKGGIDPSLDFVAQSSVVYNGPTTVTLTVSGFADSPEISLSSSPPLPQDDLLGLLLFGKPASQLTAVQLAETGATLASLSGIGGGGGQQVESADVDQEGVRPQYAVGRERNATESNWRGQQLPERDERRESHSREVRLQEGLRRRDAIDHRL